MHDSEQKLRLEFRDVEYVECIARHQNFSLAAEELHISQPALSIYVKNLERRLKISLFKRVGKKTQFTYPGRCFLEQGRQILQIRDNLSRRLSDIRRNEEGLLRIGVTSARGIFFLPLMLREFQEKYPKVRVEYREAHTQQMEKLLLGNELDIGFFSLVNRRDSLDYHEIRKDPAVLCASNELAESLAPVEKDSFPFPWIELRRLNDTPFIRNFPEQYTEQFTPLIFKYFGIEPPIAARIENQLTAINLSSYGYGVHITTLYTIYNVLLSRSPAILSFGDHPGQFDQKFVAATAKEAYRSTLIDAFIRLAREKFAG